MTLPSPCALWPRRRGVRIAAGLTLAACLAACGGGGGSANDNAAPAGQGVFTSGVVHGVGTLAVNGASFDDSAAAVSGDDGRPLAREAVQLGMVVSVQAAAASASAPAPASAVAVRSEIEGPVSAVDAAAGTLTALGQRVTVDANTVLSLGAGGLAALRVGDIVEVYGFRAADGNVLATRIEREDADEDDYKLRGTISGLDTAARRLTIGGLPISYTSATRLPATLADGQQVRVELRTRPDAQGVWQATEITLAAVAPATASGLRAELEGLITAFTSAAAFSVDGVTIDASAATRVPAGLALGRRVEVEGVLANGVLHAREVEIEDDRDDDEGLEIEGRIEALDSAAQTFVVRGMRVAWGAARFEGGGAAGLAVGVRVEVEGRLAADGSSIEASKVEFDD
ncbi:DUF5666 domain-containing protein [Piscinibacter sp.]|uniref:DUF5666 domain-containing protein n=1 Tax=Piscinibacter sp. TaxID=1903157 RepID=UPI0039E43413